MPEAHARAWAKFKANAQAIAALPAPLWGLRVVAIFYAALHLVSAYLATKGEAFQAQDHGARRRAMKRSPELRQAEGAYKLLQELSEAVRYDPNFDAGATDHQMALAQLAKVEAVVAPKLRGRGLTLL
ncbi:MAG TPA: hypothetical protein VFS43_29735 [Polyangiaceae bacterium]|nr:hypothetical protein [Polyangiaceae bacterium]